MDVEIGEMNLSVFFDDPIDVESRRVGLRHRLGLTIGESKVIDPSDCQVAREAPQSDQSLHTISDVDSDYEIGIKTNGKTV